MYFTFLFNVNKKILLRTPSDRRHFEKNVIFQFLANNSQIIEFL